MACKVMRDCKGNVVDVVKKAVVVVKEKKAFKENADTMDSRVLTETKAKLVFKETKAKVDFKETKAKVENADFKATMVTKAKVAKVENVDFKV